MSVSSHITHRNFSIPQEEICYVLQLYTMLDGLQGRSRHGDTFPVPASICVGYYTEFPWFIFRVNLGAMMSKKVYKELNVFYMFLIIILFLIVSFFSPFCYSQCSYVFSLTYFIHRLFPPSLLYIYIFWNQH
jgi:hypothetical protein